MRRHLPAAAVGRLWARGHGACRCCCCSTRAWAGPRATQAAALLVVLGAFAWLYVFIIGGQAFPLEIFPGYSASSSFGDGAIAHYAPRCPNGCSAWAAWVRPSC